MSRIALKKEKWTLSFDPELKALVVRAARRRRMYPVAFLEELVRERFDPFGYRDVRSSARYVADLRKRSRRHSDKEFLDEIRAWQKSRSS